MKEVHICAVVHVIFPVISTGTKKLDEALLFGLNKQQYFHSGSVKNCVLGCLYIMFTFILNICFILLSIWSWYKDLNSVKSLAAYIVFTEINSTSFYVVSWESNISKHINQHIPNLLSIWIISYGNTCLTEQLLSNLWSLTLYTFLTIFSSK